ncbi:MAG: hypothetical protein MMC33_002765 [Icmadophila ericetorum]|nr:hypothetical protein [Icmadophila ericetorum]
MALPANRSSNALAEKKSTGASPSSPPPSPTNLTDLEKPIEVPIIRDFAPTQTVLPAALDWTDPKDPENPLNWPLSSRIYHTTIPALMGFSTTFASSVYVPGISTLRSEFHISQTAALLGLSLYTLGLGFGPVLAAPLSETLGRRAVYFTSFPLGALFILGAGLSQTFASLLVCRFFAGFFGSAVLAIGAGTNADLWAPVHRAVATVLFLLAPFAGPAMGPIVGGYAAQSKGWRWTEWSVLMVSAAVLLYSLGMKETYKKVILEKRAKKLEIETQVNAGPSGWAAVKVLLTVTLFRPVYMLATEPIVTFLSLYISFNFSVLFGFFDAFPIVFQGVYHFSLGESGLPWLAVLTGCILSVATIIIIDRLTFRKEFARSHREGREGLVAPEHRLYGAMMGSLGLPVGLFWFAWSARSDVHWISPALAAIPFAWGNLSVFCAAALYLVDTYGPRTGASAMAANGMLRYTSGAAFPLFTVQMYNRLGISWATSLLGFLSLALLPIPWILFKYGARIRAKSKFETIRA